MRLALWQNKRQQGGHRVHRRQRLPSRHQISAASDRLYTERAQMIFKPRSPRDVQLRPRLQNGRYLATGPASNNTCMPPVAFRKYVNDRGCLAMLAHSQQNTLFAPIHFAKLTCFLLGENIPGSPSKRTDGAEPLFQTRLIQ